MVAHYIATRPILVLCEQSSWSPKARVSQRWWENAGIDMEGAKKREAEAATDLESGGEESSGASGSSGSSGA